MKGTKNEGGRRPIFTIKVHPFCFFSAVCYHSSYPNVVSGGWVGVWLGRWRGLARWVGVWLGGWVGSGKVGRRSGRVGGWGLVGWVWERLHSKVWTDAHMNATGF